MANERDCVELMQRGIAARAVSATAMNAGAPAAVTTMSPACGWSAAATALRCRLLSG